MKIMHIRSRVAIFSLASALTLTVIGASAAIAQSSTELDDTQLQQIRTNCSSTKATLDQLHVSDALLRVNRGQLYETLSIRLMNNFNGRVVSNGRDAQGLLTITQSYQTSLATFRTDYQIYERQLTATLRIDCTQEPAAFYDALIDARAKRAAVHAQVLALNARLDDYTAAIGTVRARLPQVTAQ